MGDERQHRAVVDAVIGFTNGGDVTVRGFRLDVPGPDVAGDQVGALLVAHLGLLMVGRVDVERLEIVEEGHKGGRATEAAGGADAPAARRVVDLAHPITEGMVTYPGIPAPTLGTHLSFDDAAAVYAPGTEFTIGMITLSSNTGTYLDTPAHRYRDGDDLAAVPIERLVDLDGVVVRVADGLTGDGPPAVDALAFAPFDVAGRAVLVETGHARHWGTDAYAHDHPYLTPAAADWLVEHGAALVGIDSLNIDGTHTGERPVHTRLLGAGIPVVEHLTGLDRLPPSGFRFSAPPPKVAGLGTFTVRAFAVVG
ncbi:MAG TPA: cyclase family protein [Acidimicrobiales bacterium]|nr:cyclase family protein [Acidimicrobiales bacterium]